MKKITSLFKRNYESDHLVRDEVVPGAEWVLNGEGIATDKFNGTCAMVRDGKLYKRYDAKAGRTPPPDFEAAQEADPVTGHLPGWLPVGDGHEDKYFREAFNEPLEDGTYELVGEKVQSNLHNITGHKLIKHGSVRLDDVPRSFEGLKQYFAEEKPEYIEGIVWHRDNGEMVKIKAKDFFKNRK